LAASANTYWVAFVLKGGSQHPANRRDVVSCSGDRRHEIDQRGEGLVAHRVRQIAHRSDGEPRGLVGGLGVTQADTYNLEDRTDDTLREGLLVAETSPDGGQCLVAQGRLRLDQVIPAAIAGAGPPGGEKDGLDQHVPVDWVPPSRQVDAFDDAVEHLRSQIGDRRGQLSIPVEVLGDDTGEHLADPTPARRPGPPCPGVKARSRSRSSSTSNASASSTVQGESCSQTLTRISMGANTSWPGRSAPSRSSLTIGSFRSSLSKTGCR
jgi:hypothetical protein